MISVIIPVYNSEKTIVSALDSVRIQRTEEIFEIIIINDGSTDCSYEIVLEYKKQHSELDIILINQTNQGVSSARNAGLAIARGESIALLDSDDQWHPDKTEKQLKFLNHSKYKIDLIASTRNGLKVLFPYRLNADNLVQVTFRKLLFRNEIMPSTVIFKRKILDDIGGFNSKQRYAEDVNFFLKATKNHTLYILGESLVIAGGGKRSFGVSGLSANLREMKKGFQSNIKEMYEEKRIKRWQMIFYHYFYQLKYEVLVLRKFLNL
ncbi:MAG: glycosyltransferase family A protein [Cruoricaptor ignavus]|nr:glycosyltransferase family A protein [Cruoricaptor ignavus]